MRDHFIKELSGLIKEFPNIILITGDLGFGVFDDFRKDADEVWQQELEKIKIIPVNTIGEVLKEALDWTGKQNILNKILKKK